MKRTLLAFLYIFALLNNTWAVDALKLSESFQQKIKCAGTCIVTSTPKGLIVLTADLPGSLADLDASEVLSFTLGNLAFSVPLGADPTFGPGKTKAKLPMLMSNDTTIVTGGVATVSWANNKLKLTIQSKGKDAASVAADLFIGVNAVAAGSGLAEIALGTNHFWFEIDSSYTAKTKNVRARDGQVLPVSTVKGKSVGSQRLTAGPLASENEATSAGILTVAGISPTAFNPRTVTFAATLTGASFPADASTFLLSVNGDPIPSGNITLSSQQLSASLQLVDGANQVDLIGFDSLGRPLIYESGTIWAGNRSLSVSVSGPGSGSVSVSAKLGDDQNVSASANTSIGGTVMFQNLPVRTILLSATGPNNLLATLATTGDAGTAELALMGFNPPSLIDNNDLSDGVNGWDIGSAPVQIVPESAGDASAQAKGIAAVGGFNLVLTTSGEGPVSISRTFTVKAGTKNVTLRYRFITSEVPGGYFGTEYNDYFHVSIRSQGGGGSVSDGNTMNGLGLAAFDVGGATAWREVTLPVSVQSDVVQVDVTVANVSDGLLDSQVEVDRIDERQLAITSLQLRDIDNSALNYLSATPHNYFGGKTRVHGMITVEGPSDAQLTSVTLEVVQNGATVANGTLTVAASPTLLAVFGADERVQISTSQLLFEIPSSELAAIDATLDGTLSLRVKVVSANGGEATRDYSAVQILAKYNGSNRYGQRDVSMGGDDWGLPSTISFLGDVGGITIGDISNMNGGAFPPHGSHRTGVDLDGWYSGYNDLDAGTAATMLAHLNSSYGSRIALVFVTYAQTPGDPFWAAIQNVNLNDGRRARDVIRPEPGHSTHFHWRVTP